MKKTKILIEKIIPIYLLVPLAWELIWNTIVYNGVRIINNGRMHYDIGFSFERSIPLIPWTITIYFGCFAFWLVNYILGCRDGIKSAMRFLSADFIAKTVCLVLFIAIPTTMQRPEITGTGFFDNVMRFLYTVDASDNLFPSIHCLTSWFAFIAVRSNSKVPKWYKVFSLVFAFLVFISTLTTKQHVLVDIISGWLLAEVCYALTDKTGFSVLYAKIFSRLPFCDELKPRSSK